VGYAGWVYCHPTSVKRIYDAGAKLCGAVFWNYGIRNISGFSRSNNSRYGCIVTISIRLAKWRFDDILKIWRQLVVSDAVWKACRKRIQIFPDVVDIHGQQYKGWDALWPVVSGCLRAAGS